MMMVLKGHPPGGAPNFTAREHREGEVAGAGREEGCSPTLLAGPGGSEARASSSGLPVSPVGAQSAPSPGQAGDRSVGPPEKIRGKPGPSPDCPVSGQGRGLAGRLQWAGEDPLPRRGQMVLKEHPQPA